MGSRPIAAAASLLALFLFAVDTGGQEPAPEDDARRAVRSPAVGPAAWKKRWVVEGDFGNYRTAPVAVGPDGTAYLLSDGNRSGFALRAVGADGKDRWTCALPEDGLAAPAVAPTGEIVVGLLDGTVHEISPQGKPLRSVQAGGPVLSSVTFGPEGSRYFGCRDDRMYAVKDGAVRWTFSTGGWVDAAPAVAVDGTIYVASWNAHLHALTPDGRESWKFRTRRPLLAGPVVGDDGTVYAASEDGCLYALSPDGKLLWRHETQGWIHFAPCVDAAGNVATASADGFLYSLDRTGALRWKLEVGQPSSNLVCDGNGTVFLCRGGVLQAVTSAGQASWSRDELGASSLALAADGALYVKSTQRLYRIDP